MYVFIRIGCTDWDYVIVDVWKIENFFGDVISDGVYGSKNARGMWLYAVTGSH